jgi:hypothetical protein
LIASDNAAFITGQIIRVNGGETVCVSAGQPDRFCHASRRLRWSARREYF